MSNDVTDNLKNNVPALFSPMVIRNALSPDKGSLVLTTNNLNDYSNSELGNSSSYKYDLFGTGLKSTQQLKIDWSKFEEHTFFNSAQVKTNISFDKIFNQFPFDGTKKEHEIFLDSLTGFEKYVFDNFPKYKGYAFFSGSAVNESNGGTWITVKDIEGVQYPELSREISGKSILNVGLDSMTIEMYLFLPPEQNFGQTILTKLSQSNTGYEGFNLVASSTLNSSTASLWFNISSGSKTKSINFDFPKGNFHHLSLVWDRNPVVNKVFTYVDQNLIASSSGFEFKSTYWNGIDFVIGSGSSFNMNEYSHTEQTTLSGAIDELRIWHSIRSDTQRLEYQNKTVYTSDDLKLYFKFNEPPNCESLVTIDSSGKSLHGKLNILGNSLGVREFPTSSIAGSSPMAYEKEETCPILFGQIAEVETFRTNLLISASNFDEQNPDLITKLIPKHYFLEGQVQDALESEDGSVLTELDSTTEPRTTKLGNTQILMSLLYVWAKYFDELKLFIEAFGNLNYVDYDEKNTIPDEFLQFLANQYGINLPSLFSGASIEQFIEKENIQDSISTNQLSLQNIQNQIWRRILTNLQDILKSKGTLYSIKSFIRTLGIEPDNNFRIREYGGPTKSKLNWVRENKSEISTMINFFSGGLVTSPYLVAPRVEPGYPKPEGTINDTLLTSGSFTVETWVQFPKNRAYHASQSLIKTFITGNPASLPNQTETLLSNIVAVQNGNISFYFSPNNSFNVLSMSGIDLFDGDKWYMSYGRQRNDDNLNSSVSSSYFLRIGKPINDNNFILYKTSSFVLDTGNQFSSFQTQNDSGSYIIIGSKSIDYDISYTNVNYLNNQSLSSTCRASEFEGRFGHLRFWSKYLDESESIEHLKNFKSLGVQDPRNNFNFVNSMSGSWQKLRADISTDQIITESNITGNILLTDFSQNNFVFSGSNFSITSSVVEPEKFFYSLISPKFDESSTTNKVRARSFQDFDLVNSSSYAAQAPLYELSPSERPTDSTKLTIDFSVVDALDQDIVNMFSTLDILDNIIGNPELLFSSDYPQLEVLRDVYFNRLSDKINLKLFFEFYKWFDTNIGYFIYQLIPRKTKFLGVNYVIESHMLERPKMEYNLSDIYLGDNNRHGLKGNIKLQLINGNFTRY